MWGAPLGAFVHHLGVREDKRRPNSGRPSGGSATVLALVGMAGVFSCLRFGADPVARADLPETAPPMLAKTSASPPPPAPAPPAPVVTKEPARLKAPSALVHLPVPGFGDAAIALPIGTTRPRPIVVAVHGQNSRAEWMCWMAQHVVGSRAFVVCPRGT